MTDRPQPHPDAACRACEHEAMYHHHDGGELLLGADHPFVPLLTGQRAPGWMGRGERNRYGDLSEWADAGVPVLHDGPRIFALPNDPRVAVRAILEGSPADPVRAMQDRLRDAYAEKVDQAVVGHIERAASAHDALVAEQAGPTWQHRALNLAARLRIHQAELAEVRRQRDTAEGLAERRGEHLDQLEAMIRRFAIDTGAVDAETDAEPGTFIGRLLDQPAPTEGAVTYEYADDVIRCGAFLEHESGVGQPCDLEDGHLEPHRAGGWTWR